MFLQWKLIFQKISLKNLTLIGIIILFVSILLMFFDDSCGIRHMLILSEVTSYEKSLEPELCEIIVEKIDLFNDDCQPQIEILDCG